MCIRDRYRTAAKDIMAAAMTRLDENGALPKVDEQAFFVGCPAYRACLLYTSTNASAF